MRLVQFLAAAGLIVVITMPGATAVGGLPKSVMGLDAHVHTVLTGGYWSRGDKEGFFRAVVTTDGVEATSHTLYLQWVGVDAEAGTYAVQSSVAVDEIDGGRAEGNLITLQLDADAEFGTLRLVVTVTRPRSQDKHRYVLSADGTVGTYRLEPLR